MNPLGLYVPGSSLIHRLPAWSKLLALLILGVVSILMDTVIEVLAVFLGILVTYAIAGFGPRTVLRQVWPLRWILLFIIVFQWWARGWQSAVVVAGVIVILVAAAALVTLTTRTTAMIDVLVRVSRPLSVFGVSPERVGLLVALGIRAVPVVSGFAGEIRDAQRARGMRSTPRAYAAPLIVRSLRYADDMGEALAARGMD